MYSRLSGSSVRACCINYAFRPENSDTEPNASNVYSLNVIEAWSGSYFRDACCGQTENFKASLYRILFERHSRLFVPNGSSDPGEAWIETVKGLSTWVPPSVCRRKGDGHEQRAYFRGRGKGKRAKVTQSRERVKEWGDSRSPSVSNHRYLDRRRNSLAGVLKSERDALRCR